MEPKPEQIAEMFERLSLGSPERSLGFVMWRMTHRFQREMEQALHPVGLTHLQFTLLALTAWMNRDGRAVVQADIARFGGVHPMQVSTVLRALEDKGLVRRTAAERASKRLSLTAAGLQALSRALPLAVEVQRRLYGPAGLPGGDLLALLLQAERDQPPEGAALSP